MELLGASTVGDGMVERRFEVAGHREPVQGLLWTPEGAIGPRPLVLVGHGAGGDKRAQLAQPVVRRIVGKAGFAAAAIDSIGHGDREPRGALTPSGGAPVFVTRELINAQATVIEEMIADWTITLAGLRAISEVGHGPLGFFGLSMGTLFGVPFVATNPEVRCAVLGLMGGFGGAPPWVRAAPSVTCPVFFFVQKGDKVVNPKHAKDLFRALGSPDKRLHANRGGHNGIPDKEHEAAAEFLVKHLGPSTS